MISFLSAHDLRVGYDGNAVAMLDSLELFSGQITVIGGANGSGKSTILRTLAGHLKPISGTIALAGKKMSALSLTDVALHLAYVPQRLSHPLNLTVRQLVQMGRNPHQKWWSWETSANDRQAIDDALIRTDLRTKQDTPIANLSGGELQRCAIAMALAQDSRLMLMDEPTAHLDFRHQLELVRLFHELKGTGLSLLLVLHDLNLMDRLADNLLLLERTDQQEYSTVISRGSPEDVLKESTLRRVFSINVSIQYDTEYGIRSFLPVSPSD